MIAETSIEAYKSILDDLGRRQQQVLMGFKQLEVANNRMVADYLELPINQVTGRCLELREKAYLTFSHFGIDVKTGKRTEFWKPTKKIKLKEEGKWNKN